MGAKENGLQEYQYERGNVKIGHHLKRRYKNYKIKGQTSKIIKTSTVETSDIEN